MRISTLFSAVIACSLVAAGALESSTAASQGAGLQVGTLCAKNERVIFSCPIKRPAKIVSLCASKGLTSNQGYLQYRFGLPEKIELEFPKERAGTQQKFQYWHYFRARVDRTAIDFSINGYQYEISDDYEGEEKPEQTFYGVVVTAPGKPNDVSLSCRIKPKEDYADLETVLPNRQ
jgi:hypothetical protein